MVSLSATRLKFATFRSDNPYKAEDTGSCRLRLFGLRPIEERRSASANTTELPLSQSSSSVKLTGQPYLRHSVQALVSTEWPPTDLKCYLVHRRHESRRLAFALFMRRKPCNRPKTRSALKHSARDTLSCSACANTLNDLKAFAAISQSPMARRMALGRLGPVKSEQCR